MEDAVKTPVLECREVLHIPANGLDFQSFPIRDFTVSVQLHLGVVETDDFSSGCRKYRNLLSSTGSQTEQTLTGEIAKPFAGNRLG